MFRVFPFFEEKKKFNFFSRRIIMKNNDFPFPQYIYAHKEAEKKPSLLHKHQFLNDKNLISANNTVRGI
jgi:hypothetical protein